jgi:hypothetical protein
MAMVTCWPLDPVSGLSGFPALGLIRMRADEEYTCGRLEA